jgi:hypothetical protein
MIFGKSRKWGETGTQQNGRGRRPLGRLGVKRLAVRAKLWDRPQDPASTGCLPCLLQRAFAPQLRIAQRERSDQSTIG